ncbi:protein ecdysoneless homolog [Lepeophtheirus salmonis]|uniref:protein ecdysoneless homolog n=1 Tax=Lepeophtheirus salmonis TaxID=72036 RepID=UPI001AE37F02|nr:protein ecdysoneless homolog [Lepeophtheirus salmonis]
MMSLEKDDENTVQYYIYPSSGKVNEDTLSEIYSFLFPYLNDYIWHLETFNLNCRRDHFFGKICFGENIIDEWFLFDLLIKISKKYMDFVIRIIDDDGEFPLIEAAEEIPKWAQRPDVSEGRVYIYNGHLHIIPIAVSPSLLTPFPNGAITQIDQAVNVVRNLELVTKASSGVQKCLKDKLDSFMLNKKEIFHHKTLLIPRSLACVLQQRPDLISPAIHCFVSRDCIDKRALRKKHFFKDDEDLVNYRVKFTRLLYAMLDGQKFYPDKRTHKKERDLMGVKLTSAFEVLCNRAKQKGGMKQGSILTAKYKIFENKLQEKGYFCSLLPNSNEYRLLQNKSLTFFEQSGLSKSDEAMKHSDDLINILKSDLSHVQLEINTKEDDDDDESWLTVDEHSFEEMLKKQFQAKNNNTEAFVDFEKEIPSELKSFFAQMSGYEGIDFSGNKENNMTDERIRFNPEELDSHLKKMSSNIDLDSDQESLDECFENVSSEMKEYFEELDNELICSKVEPISEKKNVSSKKELEEELSKPLNVDYTVFKNLLTSYKDESFMGGGPVSTLLKSVKM